MQAKWDFEFPYHTQASYAVILCNSCSCGVHENNKKYSLSEMV
jgi:hypothetical protein